MLKLFFLHCPCFHLLLPRCLHFHLPTLTHLSFSSPSLHLFSPIHSGLNLAPVARLRNSWEKLPSKYEKLFGDLQDVFDPSRNMAKYRNVLSSQSMQPPIIPLFPVVKKDLTFLHEGRTTLCRWKHFFMRMFFQMSKSFSLQARLFLLTNVTVFSLLLLHPLRKMNVKLRRLTSANRFLIIPFLRCPRLSQSKLPKQTSP